MATVSTTTPNWKLISDNLSRININCADLLLLGNVSNNTSNCSIQGGGYSGDPRYWLSFLFFFPAVTLFGNLLVVFSVAREKSLQTATNYFIVSLALADISLAILVMPLNIWLEIHNGHWTFAPEFCDAFIMLDVMFCTASILNLTAISIDRFMAVTQPVKYYRHRNFSRIYVTIALTWVISFGIALPIACGINYNTKLRSPNSCAFVNAEFIICSSIGSFYLPALAMLLIYYRIFRVIWERAQLKVKAVGADKKKKRLVASASGNAGGCAGGCVGDNTTPIITIAASGSYCQYRDTILTQGGVAPPIIEPASISISDCGKGGGGQFDNSVILPLTQVQTEYEEGENSGESCLEVELVEESDDERGQRHLDVSPLSKREKELMNGPKMPCLNQQLLVVTNHNKNNNNISNKKVIKSNNNNVNINSTNINSNSLLHSNGHLNNKNTIHPELPEITSSASAIVNRFETMKDFRQHLKLRIRQAKLERNRVDRNHWRPKCFKVNQLKVTLFKLPQREKAEKSVARKEKKATKTLAIVLGVFLLCWLPYFTINVIYGFSLKFPALAESPVMRMVDSVYGFFTWLGYVNSFLNPVIYTTFNAEFRRAFSKLICPPKRRRG